ncbi:hypothetical protein [Novosphingobium sp.]|uniref:hypothetical protein n=1 Tax=Novosphingobium sp. TaxID=1874826 RepID=UPI0035B013AF
MQSNDTKAPAQRTATVQQHIPEDTFGYRPDEARARLRVGKTKMAEMIREGVVESVLIGRTRIVTRRSIEALLFGQQAA